MMMGTLGRILFADQNQQTRCDDATYNIYRRAKLGLVSQAHGLRSGFRVSEPQQVSAMKPVDQQVTSPVLAT